MKDAKIKILLILMMLTPLPFSCQDDCSQLDLYVEPYFRMLDLAFGYVDYYHLNEVEGVISPMFDPVSQDYENVVYRCENMALFLHVPDSELDFHSNNRKNRFSFTQTAYACLMNQRGYMGTLDQVDKIYISSYQDFDETHPAGFDLSDIVDIFAYTRDGEEGGYYLLHDYNQNSPYEAPKRFYLLFRQNPTLSRTHQFVIRYTLTTGKNFIVETPVFNVL